MPKDRVELTLPGFTGADKVKGSITEPMLTGATAFNFQVDRSSWTRQNFVLRLGIGVPVDAGALQTIRGNGVVLRPTATTLLRISQQLGTNPLQLDASRRLDQHRVARGDNVTSHGQQRLLRIEVACLIVRHARVTCRLNNTFARFTDRQYPVDAWRQIVANLGV